VGAAGSLWPSSPLAARVSGVLQRALPASEAWHKSLLLFIATAQWMMASLSSHEDPLNGVYQNAVGFDLVVRKTCMTFQAVCFFAFFADFSCCTKHVYFCDKVFWEYNRVIQKKYPKLELLGPSFIKTRD
jgi:hypothetical protein